MHFVRRAQLFRVPLTRSINQAPNAPLNLDPSYEQLMRDGVTMGQLRRHKHQVKRKIPQLDYSVIPHPDAKDQIELDGSQLELEDEEEMEWERREERRSVAAVYGSKRIGSVELPFELINKVSVMISGIDKHELRSDAKRLYLSTSTNRWLPVPTGSTKTRKGDRSTRDGLAHISVALPAQYSVIENVLKEVRDRLGPRDASGLEGWMPSQIVDFSAGVGGALWAGLKVFQSNEAPDDEVSLPHSTLKDYVAVSANEGWAYLAQKLQENVNMGETKITYVSSVQPHTLPPETLPHTLAISAFTLSQMSSENKRREFIKRMWATGAEVMVLIDRGNKEGFINIANARRHLLRLGKHEALVAELGEDAYGGEPEEIVINGVQFVEEKPQRTRDGQNLDNIAPLAHVVAPCPHDGPCPMHELVLEGGKDFCHFSQRLQRPEFVRLTKHSGWGEEDTPYSYVVIRRGQRPTLEADSERRGTGRLGAIGKEEMLKERAKRAGQPAEFHPGEELVIGAPQEEEDTMSSVMHADHEAIRMESYEWPRILFAPMKRSGHVILDVCANTGNIERHTVSKSQGKQVYYDARKSSWGDSFPHHPKHKPVVRERGIKKLIKMRKEAKATKEWERRERESDDE